MCKNGKQRVPKKIKLLSLILCVMLTILCSCWLVPPLSLLFLLRIIILLPVPAKMIIIISIKNQTETTDRKYSDGRHDHTHINIESIFWFWQTRKRIKLTSSSAPGHQIHRASIINVHRLGHLQLRVVLHLGPFRKKLPSVVMLIRRIRSGVFFNIGIIFFVEYFIRLGKP